ncbi:hypothetical protein MRBBS_0305 [Marinobacter sp. BSs20148]|nr:hypothetical protein MRBBS_0305 [Marinobacter sp. BSs20148]
MVATALAILFSYVAGIRSVMWTDSIMLTLASMLVPGRLCKRQA